LPSITVRIDDDHDALLKEVSQEGGEYDSKSAAVRDFIQAGGERGEFREEIDELQERLDAREHRIEELEEQLAYRSQLEEVAALPDKIRERETYNERRRRLLDEASLTQRLKWRVVGVPVEAIEEERREK
jgi:hypothetical protein